jgi:pectin methylesterase-like acyl-CoA thioesterase
MSSARVWVAVDGNDNNPGSEKEPFRTIQKGIDSVEDGGAVNIGPGTYTENIVVDGRKVCISGSGKEPSNKQSTIIRPADNHQPTIIATNHADVVIRNMCILMPEPTAGQDA